MHASNAMFGWSYVDVYYIAPTMHGHGTGTVYVHGDLLHWPGGHAADLHFTFLHFTLLLNSLLSYSQNHEIISTYYEKVGSTQVHFFFWFGFIPFLGICRLTWVLKGRILKFLKLSKVHCKDTAGALSRRLLTSQFLFLKETQFLFVFIQCYFCFFLFNLGLFT